MMFTVSNHRSNSNLVKIVHVSSKSANRSTSDMNKNVDTSSKPNYHYTQKKDLSEGRTPDKKNAVATKQINFKISQQHKIVDPNNKNNLQQSSHADINLLDYKLPDLRLYKQRPPKPQLTPIKSQTTTKIDQPIQERVNFHVNDNSKKPPLNISHTKITKNRLVVSDDPRLTSTTLTSFSPTPTPKPSFSQTLKNVQVSQNFTLNYASLSKAGFDGYQEKTNQDKELIISKNCHSGAFGVMDGHGQEGEKVSFFITESLKGVLNHQFYPFDFTKVFPEVHQNLKECTGISSQLSGTTATLTIVHDNKVQCGWVGDSRAILGQRKAKKIVPLELSKDHKPDQPGERARIEQSGGLVESYRSQTGAQLGPYRVWVKGASYPGLAMSRSLGDFVAASVGVSQIPDVTQFELTSEDLFMIVASDGIWEFMSNQKVVDIVYPYYLKNDPKGACQQLYKESHSIWKQFDDGIDDITSIVIFFNRE